MIDNFNRIRYLLHFESDDEFYFVQIIQRKKENQVAGTKNHNRILRYHAITSVEKLMSLKDEMISFANYFNARVCINLNRRSFKKVGLKALKNITDTVIEEDYPRARNAWISACGQSGAVGEKRWIVDIDGEQIRKINLYGMYINEHCKPEGDKVITTLPSKNGCHLITKPFDVKEFTQNFCDIEIHKNNPTNLYIP
jgi:hypothetical protein